MWLNILNEIVPVILTALVGILSYLGITIKDKLASRIDTETKKALVTTTVKYIEQVYVDVHGDEKLQIAMTKAESLFKEKGIKIGKTELEMMIEEVVNNINKEGGK